MRKTILGLMIIIIAFTGLIFWEAKGRDMVMTEDVIVAKHDVERGSVITGENITFKRVPRNVLVDEYIKKKDFNLITGRLLAQGLIENQQISERSFADDTENELIKGKTYYVLRNDWIYMRSNALKAGDIIEIRSDDGLKKFGEFTVSFVNQKQDSSVISNETVDSSNHIEIIATLKEYLKIKSYADSVPTQSLILIQKERGQ